MTVSSTLRKTSPLPGNGVATSFAFGYKVFERADVAVQKNTIATGVLADLVLDSDYSVTLNVDQNTNPGGSVTYPIIGSPMTSAEEITIYSIVPQTQETDITNGGGFFPEAVEDALDRGVIITQQEVEKVARAFKVPISDPDPAPLPSAVARALNFLYFDANGDPTVVSGVTGTAISAAMTPVVTSATLAAARTAMGVLPIDISTLTGEIAPAIDDVVLLRDTSASTTDKMRLDDLLKVVNGLTEDTTPDLANDFALVYDTSAGTAKKVKPSNLASAAAGAAPFFVRQFFPSF